MVADTGCDDTLRQRWMAHMREALGRLLVAGDLLSPCRRLLVIASEDIEACRAARQTIENIVFEPEVGELYYGKVSNIRSEFGAWVELAPGKDGLVKIKDLEFKRTEKVEDVLKIGDMTWVKVMNVDDRGRIDLSRKDAMREKGLM